MTLGAHLAFAAVLYLGGATLFGYQPDGISGALAAGASVLGAASSACPTWVSNCAELLRQRHHHWPLHRPHLALVGPVAKGISLATDGFLAGLFICLG